MTNFLSIPGSVSKTGLILPANLSYQEWEDIGTKIRGVRETVKFIVGDWCNFGAVAYGEKYAQAISATDYDYQQLRNISWVCRQVPMGVRREDLSFAHHQAVANLDRDEQVVWLQAAKDSELSSRDLKRAITGKLEVETYQCPYCGSKVEKK
jgi:hypothetical protein